jgi:hypothetical protein
VQCESSVAAHSKRSEFRLSVASGGTHSNASFVTQPHLMTQRLLCWQHSNLHALEALQLHDRVAPHDDLSQVLAGLVLRLLKHHVQEGVVPSQRPDDSPVAVERDLEPLVLVVRKAERKDLDWREMRERTTVDNFARQKASYIFAGKLKAGPSKHASMPGAPAVEAESLAPPAPSLSVLLTSSSRVESKNHQSLRSTVIDQTHQHSITYVP